MVFVLFDGEESPAGTPDADFVDYGLRGSQVGRARYREAEAMILLDFVGEKDLASRARATRTRGCGSGCGPRRAPSATGSVSRPRHSGGIADDHSRSSSGASPSIDLIDFDFDCWHKPCDDLSAVSERSLDATGESVLELLRKL